MLSYPRMEPEATAQCGGNVERILEIVNASQQAFALAMLERQIDDMIRQTGKEN